MYYEYIRVTEGKNKKEMKKEGKMRISILIFIKKICFTYLKVYTTFENIEAEKSVTEITIGEKGK